MSEPASRKSSGPLRRATSSDAKTLIQPTAAKQSSDRLPVLPKNEEPTLVLPSAMKQAGVDSAPSMEAIDATISGERSFSESCFRLPNTGLVLGAEIGRGGLGLIREASQEVFGRQVAIKTLHRSHTDPEIIASFYAEAVATASLQHPNIIPIHDLIESEGELRLVMKRVVGVTWHELLHPKSDRERRNAAKYDFDDHLEILAKIIDAVAFAHSRGILHRDLKPANVMVGNFGEVLLMDWGCAVTYGEHHLHGIPQAKHTTAITGTPTYLAPEMAKPDPIMIGPASDIFLLGGLLYEILTGQRPHFGKTIKEVLTAARTCAVMPPSQRSPERPIPKELARLAMQCLQSDIAKRPPSALDLAARLKRYFLHRDALRLAEKGLKLIESAGTDLEIWAKAVAYAEQSLEIWPRCPDGRELRIDAGLRYAQCAFDRGSFVLAATQAKQVSRLAEEWGKPEISQEAQGLALKAGAQEEKIASRERHFVRMRKITRIAVIAVVIVSVVLGTASSIAFLRMRQAQEEHAQTQRQAAPAWIARATSQLEKGDLVEAATFVDLAVRFNPDSSQARMLAAELSLMKGDMPAAQAALKEAARCGQGGLEPLLQSLAKLPPKPSGPQRDELAKDLSRAGMDRAARSFFADRTKRLEIYKERVAKALGKDGTQDVYSMSMDEKGNLKVALYGRQLSDAKCLEGMPVTDLEIRSCPFKNLDSLRGLPLVRLSIFSAPIKDLSPLVGMKLEGLTLSGIVPDSCAPLRGMPITSLIIPHASCDWSPLADLPNLQSLILGGGRLDLSWLKGKPMKSLDLSGVKLESMAVLRECKLESLLLRNVTCPGETFAGIEITDIQTNNFAPLVGSRIGTLRIIGYQDTGTIKLLKGLRPKKLFLQYCSFASYEPLIAMEPETVEILRSAKEPNLSPLRTLKGTIDSLEIPRFFALGEALAKITGKPNDDTIYRYVTSSGYITITLNDLEVRDLRPLSVLGQDLANRTMLNLVGCKFGSQAPLVPDLKFYSIDISFSDVRDPTPFLSLTSQRFAFFGIPLSDAARLSASQPIEGLNSGIPLVAGRMTLQAILHSKNLRISNSLWFSQCPDLALYEVMRLELTQGHVVALKQLSEYQKSLTGGNLDLANRLSQVIEARHKP